MLGLVQHDRVAMHVRFDFEQWAVLAVLMNRARISAMLASQFHRQESSLLLALMPVDSDFLLRPSPLCAISSFAAEGGDCEIF
jgi:hypothetical protein